MTEDRVIDAPDVSFDSYAKPDSEPALTMAEGDIYIFSHGRLRYAGNTVVKGLPWWKRMLLRLINT